MDWKTGWNYDLSKILLISVLFCSWKELKWALIKICYISQSLTLDFSIMYEYIFMSFFSWSFFTICGTLLMIQMEIVEYISLNRLTFKWNNFCSFSSILILVPKYGHRSICANDIALWDVLVVCSYFHLLRVWRESEHWIQWIERCNQSIQLVHIPDRDSARPADCYDFCPGTSRC